MTSARRILQLWRRAQRLEAQASRQRDTLETTEAQLALTRAMLAELEAMAAH